MEIADEYLEKYPKAKDSGDVLYEESYLLYTHHDLPRAFKGFWTLVQKYPRHETAIPSAYLILDVLNRRKDYPKLIASCQKFLVTPEFTNPAFKTDVADILRKSELKRIQLIEAKGDFKEAADNYIEYTKAYGGQDEVLFEKALYNASVDYSKANLLLPATETQEKFLRRFPKSPLRENMLLQVAKAYETLASFEKAASYFEMYTIQYPRSAQTKNALRLAGLYYWGSGNGGKGESIMQQFTRQYPADSKMVERDLVDLYEGQGAGEKQIAYYLGARAMRGLSLSQYLVYTMKIAEISAKKSGKMSPRILDEGFKVAQKYGKEIAQTPKGVEAMSKLYFWYANQRENVFYSLKLGLPQSQLEANLSRKMNLIKEIEREYQKVAGLGSPEWGIGAIYKTAAAYRHLAQTIQAAPIPAELSAEQIDEYRKELTKRMVKPFNEKAKGLAASCLDKAQEFNVMSSWTARCYGLAGELEPERYPLARTLYLPSVRTALTLPAKTDKIEIGNVKLYSYPFFSSALFDSERAVATANNDLPQIYDDGDGSESRTLIPTAISYRVLSDERKKILKSALNAEKPDDVRKPGSFAYLNLLRVNNPAQAVPQILRAIIRDPGDGALHNLLGLAYLESGNGPAAKVSWLSMIAQGSKSGAVWNNLGVIANLEGNESQAIEYFQEAVKAESQREALVNLGFISLKYRNGFEAKKLFEKARGSDADDVSARVGLYVAQLQNRELDSAKEGLIETAKKYKSDPYARLSMGYLLLDVEKEYEIAKKTLSEYIDQQSLESDVQFRKALQEATSRTASAEGAGDLPTVE